MEINTTAAIFKALGSPTRLALFVRLAQCCCGTITCSEQEFGACVMELGEGLGLSPSTISHHVRELRLAGLIQQERKGREIVCCVDVAAVESIITFFRGLYPSCGTDACAPAER